MWNCTKTSFRWVFILILRLIRFSNRSSFWIPPGCGEDEISIDVSEKTIADIIESSIYALYKHSIFSAIQFICIYVINFPQYIAELYQFLNNDITVINNSYSNNCNPETYQKMIQNEVESILKYT